MKTLAIYLPAFHRIKENDAWWGEGFTEWDNVRQSEPLYPGHVQPEHPLRYYDLSDAEEIRHQISLANRYHVDGFLIYHYWFGGGRTILEKPAEILREQIRDKTEYCFCWANHSWESTWRSGTPEVLIRQEYGGEEDWQQHIEYLYPFFEDERYIKMDGHPVFFFYMAGCIPRFREMIEAWNRYLASRNMKSLYVIEYISTKNKKVTDGITDAVIEFEPLYSMFFDLSPLRFAKRAFLKLISRRIAIPDYQDYDYAWNCILKRRRTYGGKKIYRSCFTKWDNTPRKGRRALVVRGAEPGKFEKYLERLTELERRDLSDEFLVINAWNEWGEGAVLEPSEADGYAYLEAVNRVMEKYRKRG